MLEDLESDTFPVWKRIRLIFPQSLLSFPFCFCFTRGWIVFLSHVVDLHFSFSLLPFRNIIEGNKRSGCRPSISPPGHWSRISCAAVFVFGSALSRSTSWSRTIVAEKQCLFVLSRRILKQKAFVGQNDQHLFPPSIPFPFLITHFTELN